MPVFKDETEVYTYIGGIFEEAKGPIPKILKLVPLTKILFPRYRESLVRSGRSDLVEA